MLSFANAIKTNTFPLNQGVSVNFNNLYLDEQTTNRKEISTKNHYFKMLSYIMRFKMKFF